MDIKRDEGSGGGVPEPRDSATATATALRRADSAVESTVDGVPYHERYTGRMVTGVYHDPDDAMRVYYDLTSRHGYPYDAVNVVMSDETRRRHFAGVAPEGELDGGTRVIEGAGLGVAIGSTLGGVLAGLVGLGAALVLPGIGIVVGPIAAAIAGAGVGGTAGGLLGALIGAGFPEDLARTYEKAIADGGIIVSVHARDDDHAVELERAFSPPLLVGSM